MTRRWREFRIEYLPVVTFALSVTAVVALWGEFALPKQIEAAVEQDSTSISIPLDTTQAAMASFAGFAVHTTLTNASVSASSAY